MPVIPQPSSSHTGKLGHKHVRWMWYDTLRRSVAYQTYKCEHHGFAVTLTANILSWRVGWVMTADRLHLFLSWQGKTTDFFYRFFSGLKILIRKSELCIHLELDQVKLLQEQIEYHRQECSERLTYRYLPWSFLCRNLSVSLHYSWEQNLYTAGRTTWKINASETICFTW